MYDYVGLRGKNINRKKFDLFFKGFKNDLAISKGDIPVETNDNLVLIFDGDIYNLNSIKKFLKLNKTLKDSKILLNLINHFYENNDLIDSVKETIKIIDGEYSFTVFNKEDIVIVEDKLGTKPVYYYHENNSLIFGNNKNLKDVKRLKPGNILYNEDIIFPKEYLWNKKLDINSNYNKDLEKLLKEAILKRVNDLDEVAVIFSGGIDSTIITKIIIDSGLDVKLYSVGNKESKDIITSKKIAEYLNLPLKIQEINKDIVYNNLKEVLTIIGENNLMKIGVGMTIFLGCKMIKEDGFKVAISGQGADELFGGYNRYLKSFKEGILDYQLRHDIENMYHVNLERDYRVSKANNIKLRLPFLDERLVEYTLNIPVKYKIINENDKLRKNILRDIGVNLNIPKEFAYRPKKAAQYGSGIDKILRKKINLDSFI